MITDAFSITNIPARMGNNNSLRINNATTAMIAPMVKLPVSPINTCAGKALNHKNPTNAPAKALINTETSPIPGIYMIFK